MSEPLMGVLSAKNWVVLGAGRLGRGFLAPVAQELGFRLTLVVGGHNTNKDLIERLNQEAQSSGYSVLSYDTSAELPSETTAIRGYSVMLASGGDEVSGIIASADTNVVSTSISIHSLNEAAAALARGIEARAIAQCPEPLLILACENGRSTDGLTAAQKVRQLVEDSLHEDALGYFYTNTSFPDVVVDCVVPEFANPLEIRRGWGVLWVANNPLTRRLLSGSKLVVLTDSMPFAHVKKLYGFNSLHCYLSVLAYVTGKSFVYEIAEDPGFEALLRQLKDAITVAICNCCSHTNSLVAEAPHIGRYVQFCLERITLRQDTLSDPVDRVINALRSGRYVKDGRLIGPLFDLGLNRQPSANRVLVRLLSISLYLLFRETARTRALPAADINEFLVHMHRPGVKEAIDSRAPREFVSGILMTRANAVENFPLVDAVVEDFDYLAAACRGRHDFRLSVEELTAFVDRSMLPSPSWIPEAPRDLDLACVIFDLDEGLISSERLIYEVTRQIVEMNGAGRLAHDDYAKYVGMEESEFFSTCLIPTFQMRIRDPKQLIELRDSEYLNRLLAQDPESFCKPGFRSLLRMLKKAGVPTAIYSNASRRRILATLEHLGLRDSFDVILSSSDAGMAAKPSPSMIDEIMRIMKVGPKNCLVVDSSSYGLGAANQAGCCCAIISNDYTSPIRLANRSAAFVGNVLELEAWIGQLIRIRGQAVASVADVGSDLRFPYSPRANRESMLPKVLSLRELMISIKGLLAGLPVGRQFIGVTGTVGSRKQHWAEFVAEVLRSECNRSVVVISEDYFLLESDQRKLIREELYSQHEFWIDWGAFF
jgi:beta-phosphoglucomutase-like phosphatase (HAD superfamily)